VRRAVKAKIAIVPECTAKSAAERNRDRYWREKLGLGLYTLKLNRDDLTAALVSSGWCPRSPTPTEKDVRRALRRLLLTFIEKNLTRKVNILQAAPNSSTVGSDGES
jgi:hypothetical protein